MNVPKYADAEASARTTLTADDLDRLRRFDTCTLANAIEVFEVRLRNQGFTGAGIHCLFQDFPPMLGYAVTGRVKSSNPPMTGRFYDDRTEWWSTVESHPAPRIAVMQDLEAKPGQAAVAGAIHAQVFQKLGCQGLITNGAVRDIPTVRNLGFPVFAAGVAVSHSYFHLVDFGTPVEICGLAISPGDLLYADCHGVLSIPLDIAALLPRVAEDLVRHEQRIFDFCRSPHFSLEKLKSELQSYPGTQD